MAQELARTTCLTRRALAGAALATLGLTGCAGPSAPEATPVKALVDGLAESNWELVCEAFKPEVTREMDATGGCPTTLSQVMGANDKFRTIAVGVNIGQIEETGKGRANVTIERPGSKPTQIPVFRHENQNWYIDETYLVNLGI